MCRDADVVIVGAGPIGLALAGDLAWRGRSAIVIDRGTGAITQPKMDMVGIRTMEFCRRWDIVDAVENSPYPRDYPQDNVYLTALRGYELGRERFPSMGDDLPPPESPQKRERCPQNMFDPILKSFATGFASVDLRYGLEFVDFEQSGSEVEVSVLDVDSGMTQTLKAAYVVGCDGGRSAVARRMGVEYDGSGVLTYTTNAIFRCADLNQRHDKDPGYRYIFIGPEGTWGTIVAINGNDQWRISIVGGSSPQTLTEDDIRTYAYRALGAEFPIEILSIVPWVRSELIAQTYRQGRVFIAGDAAHVMSPTGGFGMNTGIGDAVDLSWKLDALLSGWGGETLLESYEKERRPVAVRNVNEASGNLKRMLSPGTCAHLLDESQEGEQSRAAMGEAFSEAMRREWYTLDIHLGYVYSNSPVCVDDGTPVPPSGFGVYTPTTRPGARAPHVALKAGASTLDWYGRGFVLVVCEPQAELESWRRSARQFGIPLRIRQVDDAAVARAYETGLVLVRPDGHVAWRGAETPTDVDQVLRTVTGQNPC